MGSWLDSACPVSAALACGDACVRSALGARTHRNHWISRRPATFARCWRSSREGPDHLIGFSYGAHLAYQVACKLAAAQQSVGLLALVDAAPGFERTEPMAGEHLIRGDMRIARPELDHRAYAHVPARILDFRSSFRFESSFLLPGGGWEELALGGVETYALPEGTSERLSIPWRRRLDALCARRWEGPPQHQARKSFIVSSSSTRAPNPPGGSRLAGSPEPVICPGSWSCTAARSLEIRNSRPG